MLGTDDPAGALGGSGYSPATLAVAIAALVCAADFARSRGQREMALFLEEYADFLESHVERWTVGWRKGRAWPLLTGERAHYELVAGRDVQSFLRAIEGFASRGGMLPEQVWDEADRPEQGLYLGRPAGSVMPLVWAHAEYITLLRSVADGHVFDLISVVANRYLTGQGRKDLEVWKPNRRMRRVAPGQVLRVQAPSPFRLRWTADEWQSLQDTTSYSSGLGIFFVDLPVAGGQRAPIRFTFFWTNEERWEGRDYSVEVDAGS